MKEGKMDSEIKSKGDVKKRDSELRLLKQELVKTRERAKQSEMLKSAFLNNISHEIRTPLNGILGFLDFFEDDLSMSDRNQFVSIMRKNGERLLNMIDDIIEMSKLESGNIEESKSIFDLNVALEEFDYEVRQKYSNQNIRYISNRIDLSGQTMIEADCRKMFQILRNLLDNAFKFTEKGFVKLSISRDKNNLIFEIEDTGIGIKKDDRDVIFEPFRQADFNLNRKYEGSGLGLTISKRLIHLMGGELSFKTHEDIGTKFKCKFPDLFVQNFKKAESIKKIYKNETPSISNKIHPNEKDHNGYPYLKTVG